MTTATHDANDLVGSMMAYEVGELGFADTVRLIQRLIDDGTVWSLQGCYGRQADAFIRVGHCHYACSGRCER